MNQRDLLVRIDSEFNDRGFKNAEASAKAMVRELDRQEKATRDLANMQSAAARENEQRHAAQLSAIGNVGKAVTGLGVITAIGMGVAAKAASDWESAFAGVRKTVDGTDAEIAALEGEFRQLAKTLPATAEEIAAVGEEAGALGVKRGDLVAFTKTAIDLGETTNLSASDAATGLAKLGNIMGVLPTQSDRAGAALVALGNNGASTEDEILSMGLRIAGAGKTIGLTEAQVLGFASALSSVGIEAEAGGSSISRVMVDISTAVEDGGAKLDTFARVAGMSAGEFSARFRTDAAGAITAFIAGLGQMQASGQSVFGVLSELNLSEIRVRDTLLRASGASDMLTSSLDIGSQAWRDNMALVEEANKRYETSEARIQIARNQLNDAAIDIGGTVLPAIAGAAERVGFLSEAFQGLPDGVKSSVAILGGAVAVLGTIGGLALVAIPKLAAMNATLAATGPVGARAAKGLSAAGSALAGPWGIALAGATVAMGIWANKQFEAKQRTEELTASLDVQTGAVTANTRQIVAAELRQRGVIKAAEALGIASRTVVDAATGEAGALAEIEAAARRAQQAHEAALPSFQQFAQGQTGLSDAAIRAGEAQSAQGGGAITLLAQIKPLHDEILGLTADKEADATASGVAEEAAQGFTTGLEETKDAAHDAAEEIKDLIEAVEGYGENTINARKANRDYQETIDKIAEREKDRIRLLGELKEARGRDVTEGPPKDGKETADQAEARAKRNAEAKKAQADAIARIKAELEGYNLTLDANTEAGRTNQELQEKIRTDTLSRATAYFQEGRSLEDVTKMVMAGRERFVEFSVAQGMSKKEANRLADQLGLTKENVETLSTAIDDVPESHKTNMIVATAAAREAVEALQRKINGLNGKDVRIGVRYNAGTLPNGGRDLTGGIAKDFDGGGYTGDIPRTAKAGNVHGREFVSDADTTAQWRGLLEHMHAGGDPRSFLGMSAQPAPSLSTSVVGPTSYSEKYDQRVVAETLNVYANNPAEITRRARLAPYEANRRAY